MNIFKKLKEGLTKTRQNIVAGFDSIFSGHKAINDDFYDELEEVMIMGDMGVRATDEILEDLKVKVKEQKIKDPAECRQLLIDTIKEKIDLGENAYDYENTRSALLIIGVNGVGKTTSVGKLAASLKSKGKKVILAAADTFRAGAIDQLKIWGKRAGVDVVAQQEGADPGAVIFDAVQASKARGADVLIADTAGRLHNKKNLMSELSKIDRIIEREYPDCYRENLIVLDATTGQNAISQLREFNEVTDITGIILTKMDGTAKGGIIVAIQAEFGIPVKYIGVGEKIEDLQKFDSNSFVNALFDVDLSDDEMEAFEYEEIDEEALAADEYTEEYGEEPSKQETAEDVTETAQAEKEITGQDEDFNEDINLYPGEPSGVVTEPEEGHVLSDAVSEEVCEEPEEDVREETYEAPAEAAEETYETPAEAAEETYEATAEEVTEETYEESAGEVTEESAAEQVQDDEVPDFVFEDISDEDDDLYDDEEDDEEYTSEGSDDDTDPGEAAENNEVPEYTEPDEDEEEQNEEVRSGGEYHDRAYEAFLGRSNAGNPYDPGSSADNDTFADEDIYEDYHTEGDDGSYGAEDDTDYDDQYDEPRKRKGLFGLFKKRK